MHSPITQLHVNNHELNDTKIIANIYSILQDHDYDSYQLIINDILNMIKKELRNHLKYGFEYIEISSHYETITDIKRVIISYHNNPLKISENDCIAMIKEVIETPTVID